MISNLTGKARVWLRERKERAAERRALKRKPAVPHGAAPLIWVWFLAFIAVATLIGSTWMLMVFIAGSVGHVDWGFDWRAGNDGEPSRWLWFAEARIHILVGLGLLCFCLGIAAFNAVWLHVRTHLHGLFRMVVTGLGAAVALFMVSGAIVVQQWGTLERERDEIAEVRATGVAAATARERLETARQQLADLRNHSNQYMAVAASVGADEFERSYLSEEALRGSDQARRDLLRRSLGAARRADALEAEIAGLEAQAAEAQVTAASAEVERVELEGWMPWFSRLLEDIRKPFIAVLGELLAMTMFGVALAAALSRRQTVEGSGWAPEDHRIEDLREEAEIPVQPMKPMREAMFDADTGAELIYRKATWAKKPKRKGKPTKVAVEPDIPPDEQGVEADGGQRQAVSVIEPQSQESLESAPSENDDSDEPDSGEPASPIQVHPEPSEHLTDEEAAAIAAAEAELEIAPEAIEEEASETDAGSDEAEEQNEAESVVEAQDEAPLEQTDDAADEPAHDEPVGEDDAEPDHRQPETRPDRLIAAE